MGIEKVRDEIIENAKAQASFAAGQARKKAGEALREAEEKVENYRKEAAEEAKKAMLDIKKQEMARAELEVKKSMLKSKKALIDEVFEDAKKEAFKMKEKEMSNAVLSLLERAKKDMQVEYVYCNKRDLKSIHGFNAKEAEISGGIIAENREQTVRIDCSFEALFESLRENCMQEVAKKLFSEN